LPQPLPHPLISLQVDIIKHLLQQQQEVNKQLESYSLTLEEKVEARTRELREKNNYLKQLLDELHRTQTQMVESEKMSALGQMVAGVATKPVGKGTGLGLSISYQIVTEKHHGRLYCNTTPGQGTKFVIEIPIRQFSHAAA